VLELDSLCRTPIFFGSLNEAGKGFLSRDFRADLESLGVDHDNHLLAVNRDLLW
jgi:hypothetical protein